MKKKVSVIFFAVCLAVCLMVPLFTGCATGEIVYCLSEEGDHYFVYASRTNISEEAFNGICPYYSEETGPVTEPLEGTLPVTSIAGQGFFGCSKFKNIEVPDFITNIGYSAFAYCQSLESFKFPDNENFKTVPYGIFGGDKCLNQVEIPETVERIEAYAFYSSCLYEVTIPASVTYMGAGVFYRDEYLTKADIYAQIDAVPYATFCSCMRLEEVTLSSTIKEIKGYEYVNKENKVISEDDIIPSSAMATDEEKADPNYEDNVSETVPAFYYTYLESGSDTITFDYELQRLYYLGTEAELNDVVVGEYNVCLTESTVLTVYCWEDGAWKEVNWNFGQIG